MKVTSCAVSIRGSHAHVSVFIDGKLSGTLVVGADEAEALVRLLGQPAAPRAPCKYRGNKPECPYCHQPAAAEDPEPIV